MASRFVIKRGPYYLANHPSMNHWTEDVDKAMTFEFMTIALGITITMMHDNGSNCTIEIV